MIHLLDVNVLLALAWPNHVHHNLARRWFGSQHKVGWATCSVSETGFVRISANAKVVEEARTPAEAIVMLRRLVAIEGHRFWKDDVSIASLPHDDTERIVGYRQVTDAHLIALVRKRSGRLATFDRRVRGLLPANVDPTGVVTIVE